VLKVAPRTASALAGQGYVALAREDAARAVSRFDEALAVEPSQAAALVGKGQALLELERPADALAAFEAAQNADPQLTLAPRIETLRFRVVEDSIGRARELAKGQQWDAARAAYEAALRVSPDSAVLYRELAGVERRAGLLAEADAHLGRALELDPQDRATQVLLGEAREEAGDFDGAIASYEAALKLEPSADVETRLARTRERADLASLPEAFQALATAPEATRADLAAALGLRVPGLLARAQTRATPVITDLRGHWARPWIVATLRAGVLDAYPNHTFQPAGRVPRAELALAVRKTLDLLAGQGDRRAEAWQRATPELADVPRSHPAYAAAAQAVAAGVLDAPANVFAPTRAVSGQEVLEAVSRLQRLAGPLAGRDRR
jgi:tetratricopeptide (TPR) repeat protein